MSTPDHSLSASQERNLHAYHDGQLGPVARWWWRRRIARSQGLSERLDELTELGNWVREADLQQTLQQNFQQGPDLWDQIAMRLPAIDAARAETSADDSGLLPESLGQTASWMARWTGFRPIMAAAATAAVALAIVLGTIGDAPGQQPGAVRWLDTGGRSVIVLDKPDSATIVWLLEPTTEGI